MWKHFRIFFYSSRIEEYGNKFVLSFSVVLEIKGKFPLSSVVDAIKWYNFLTSSLLQDFRRANIAQHVYFQWCTAIWCVSSCCWLGWRQTLFISVWSFCKSNYIVFKPFWHGFQWDLEHHLEFQHIHVCILCCESPPTLTHVRSASDWELL